MANNYEAEKAYFANKKPAKAAPAKVVDAARKQATEALKASVAKAATAPLGGDKKPGSREGLVPGTRKLPAQSATEAQAVVGARKGNDYSATRADLPAGLRQSAEPILRAKVPRKELNESEATRRESISNRANRVSGPSLPPPFKQHRHVEEVLMLARRAAKRTYTDASELAGARGVLNHAASNLEDAGQHHARGNYGAAHSSLLVAAHSLDHAVGRIDAAHGGNAPWGTPVHPSTALKNHLNSYRDEYL